MWTEAAVWVCVTGGLAVGGLISLLSLVVMAIEIAKEDRDDNAIVTGPVASAVEQK